MEDNQNGAGIPIVLPNEYRDHELLENLLGGDENGHYHLTREQLEWLNEHMADTQKPVIRSGQSITITAGKEIEYQIEGKRTN